MEIKFSKDNSVLEIKDNSLTSFGVIAFLIFVIFVNACIQIYMADSLNSRVIFWIFVLIVTAGGLYYLFSKKSFKKKFSLSEIDLITEKPIKKSYNGIIIKLKNGKTREIFGFSSQEELDGIKSQFIESGVHVDFK